MYKNILGVFYNNKIYIADGDAEVYDGATNTWKAWPKPIYNMSNEAW
jgi:hypothetical protein